jgi:BirA family biotin operon repressor/biotin-[acetyl-CoA-carboxylase] ligase
VESPIHIKWPNDVIVGTKKLAGVLVESRLRGTEIEAVVIGVGINVHMIDVPAEIASVATSLALLGDPSPTRELLLVDILAELEARLDSFGDQGLVSLTEELRLHDGLMDVPVRIGDVVGTAAGIAEDGALLVRDKLGRVQQVSAGTVERTPG